MHPGRCAGADSAEFIFGELRFLDLVAATGGHRVHPHQRLSRRPTSSNRTPLLAGPASTSAPRFIRPMCCQSGGDRLRRCDQRALGSATCHHGVVRHCRNAGLIGTAVVAICATQFAPMPTAQAGPCPDAEVVFARGTTEEPGPGPTGQAFIDSLRSRVGAKSVGAYAVDYPATTDFPTAVVGIADARTHILATAANCPQTKMVLGGFSQGAAVMGFVTADVVPDGVSVSDVPPPMPPDIADHIAAIALFGKPSPRFMHAINDPSIAIGTEYVSKTIDLCVDNDLVCDPHGTSFAAHNQYTDSGMVDQGAVFVSNLLQAKWAADVPVPSPSTTRPLLTPSAPSPLSAPVGPVGPSGLLAGDAAHPAAHLPSGPMTPPGPATPTNLPPPVGPLA